MVHIALQVWIPCVRDLSNQGLSNTTITSSGATYNTSGKLGGCYNMPSGYITGTYEAKVNMTFACWVYFNSTVTGHVFDARNTSTGKGYQPFCITGATQIQAGNSTNGFPYFAHSMKTGIWYHLCVTHDANECRFYINGSLVGSTTSGRGADIGTCNFHIGSRFSSENYSNIKVNDIRIYDNTLSPKEIEILSRGLVVHYPLSLPMPNLAKGSNTDSTSTNSFGFSEATGGSTRTIEYDGGIPCAKITRNSTAHGSWSFLWYSNWDRAAIKPSTTYTLSFDIIGSGSGNISLSGFMQGNATNNICSTVQTIQGTFNADKWSHLVFRATTINDFTGKGTSQTIYMGCGFLNGVNTWIMMKNMKLEEGVNDTPWIPHTSDAGYSTMGLNDTTEYDVSGYNYHGARTDITYSSDTARYSTSSVFNGSSSRIYCGTINLGNTWSYGVWYKSASVSSSWQAVVILNTSGGDTDLQLGFYTCHSENRFQSSANGKYNAQIPLPHDTNWHYFFATYDGASLKTYMDGALVNTTSITAALLARSNLTLGARCGNASGTSFNAFYKGSLSDFRLYSTCLSATQVAELYNTAVSISNNGTLFGYELVES